MAGGITWFSLASLLLPALAITPATTAAGLALPAVILSRFLVGFGEGVALPSMNALVARRVPPALKATALGSCFSGFHTGALEVAAESSCAAALSGVWRAAVLALQQTRCSWRCSPAGL